MRSVRRFGLVAVALALGLLVSFALPVETWRTGRQRLPDLAFAPAPSLPAPSSRIWIDTDAACGHGSRTDVDDCLALLLLARMPGAEIVGVSTVFGNAPLDVTDRTTRELVGRLSEEGEDPIAVLRGSGRAVAEGAELAFAARDALEEALEDGPLTIVALGPLSNIAVTLEARPDLRRNVAMLVAVMGRRAGHLFHPSEGSGRGMLLGHGPVFRDFNFATDREATAALVAMRVPMALVPYDAARGIEVTAADLDRLEAAGGAAAWVARRSRAWLDYWNTQIGRAGFYPFDLVAAAYVRSPQLFRCARVEAWVGRDPRLFVPLLRPRALLVGQRAGAEDVPEGAASVVYCPAVEPGLDSALRSWLVAAPGGQAARLGPAAVFALRASAPREAGHYVRARRFVPARSIADS